VGKGEQSGLRGKAIQASLEQTANQRGGQERSKKLIQMKAD